MRRHLFIYVFRLIYSSCLDGICNAFSAALDAPDTGRWTREMDEVLIEEFMGDGAAPGDNDGIDEDVFMLHNLICCYMLVVLLAI